MARQLFTPLALAATITAGCGPTTKPDALPRDIVISGTAQFIGTGGSSQWTAMFRLTDFSETTVTGEAAWTSSDPKVASVSTGGLVTAVGFGSTIISASYRSRSGQKTVQVAPLAPIGLAVTTSLSFTSVGQTSQLAAAVRFNDNSTVDVSADTQWSSNDPSIVALTPSGALTTTGLGSATIGAQYGALTLVATVTVLPPGTFITSGRVRLPGNGGGGQDLGVPGFSVTNTDQGNSVLSDAKGQYSIAAVALGTRLTFEKTGYEPAELIVAGPSGSPTVQQQIRIQAGDSATTTIFENDITFDPSPSFHCDNCRLIRVVAPAAGTLHVEVDWSSSNSLALWVNGAAFPATGVHQLLADVPVAAGESLLYVRAGAGNFASLTLKTSLSGTLDGGVWE